MIKLKPLYIIFSLILLFVISGCTHDTGFKKVELDPDLFEPPVNEEDSVVNELTPIITVGDEVTVPVYRCTSDTDCNRCKDGDVYSQTCVIKDGEKEGNCQGSLDLAEDCKDKCSEGKCIDEDVFTAEETIGTIGEDDEFIDVDEIINDIGIVDNEDLLPDETECSNKIEQCIGYRGIGSAYLSKSPECKCKLIYVPAGCNPNEAPCPDFSSRTKYPDCECK